MLDSMSFFALASKRLDWLAARQKVISENVANANTPDFLAKEVAGFDSVLAGTQSGMTTTNARHIATGSGGQFTYTPTTLGSRIISAQVADHFGVTVAYLAGEDVEADDEASNIARMFRQARDLDPDDQTILDDMIQSMLRRRKKGTDGG